MVISKYTTNLYKSEVYRELERQAIRKGFFNATEEEIVKNATSFVKKASKKELTESNDLIQDITLLAAALREKGFDKHAEEIEDNLLKYKKAESLYNLNIENGNDMIDFAHRDGDVQIVDGGELGVVETTKSIADKILAVVNKQPTGQLPKNASLNDLASFVKNAQDYMAEPISLESTKEKKNQVDATIVAYKDSIINNLKVLNDSLKQINLATFDNIIKDDGTSDVNFLMGKGHLSSIFNQLGGNSSVVVSYGALSNFAFKNSKPNVGAISNILTSVYTRQDVQARLDSFNKILGTNYKVSNFDNKDAFNKEINNISIQIFNKINDVKLKAIAEVNKVKINLNKQKFIVNNICKNIEKFTNAKLDSVVDYRLYITNLHHFMFSLDKILSLPNRVIYAFDQTNGTSNYNNIKQTIPAIIGNISEISKLLPTVEDAVDINIVRDMILKLKELSGRFGVIFKNHPELKAKYLPGAEIIPLLGNAIRENYSAGAKELLGKLKSVNNNFNYKSVEDINSDISTIENGLVKIENSLKAEEK